MDIEKYLEEKRISTTFIKFIINRAHLAQLAERKTEDLEVAGSTPAVGRNLFFKLHQKKNGG